MLAQPTVRRVSFCARTSLEENPRTLDFLFKHKYKNTYAQRVGIRYKISKRNNLDVLVIVNTYIVHSYNELDLLQ